MSLFDDPTYPAFPIFAFLGFILVLIPLPWHLQAWNSGTCLFMIWTAIGCLNLFINSLIWHGNAIDWAPVWCDISTRLVVGISVAIPAASLCINRRLYKIASCQTATLSRGHKRRAVMIDLAIGLGIPFLQMPLQFIVQGHRYDIFQDIGCYPTTVNTPPAYPLSLLWPSVIGLVSAIYCILTLRAFMQRRAQFGQLIASNSSLTINRYFRLMSLATLELLFNVPITTYGLYVNITSRPIYPWTSWSDIHHNWYVIDTFPRVLWGNSTIQVVNLELSRWGVVFCAFLFFGFFGFAEEARKNYRKVFHFVSRRFGYDSSSSSQKKKTGFVYVPFVLPLRLPLIPFPCSHVEKATPIPTFTPRPLHLASTATLTATQRDKSTNCTRTLSISSTSSGSTKVACSPPAFRLDDIKVKLSSSPGTMSDFPSSPTSMTTRFDDFDSNAHSKV
uniref:Pheromone receptor Rcb3 B45 n=1 Tax=Coprinopsis cinerea TaxID=5346 RepID=Q6TMC6_COPCI|nr:pheromone receptor Rcb3 B45 [Coprinopsis cinerea]